MRRKHTALTSGARKNVKKRKEKTGGNPFQREQKPTELHLVRKPRHALPAYNSV